jgi:hypothetical protein
VRATIDAVLRYLGIVAGSRELAKFEPIYGLPKQSLDAWLSRNPQLKKAYELKLQARSISPVAQRRL